MKNYPFKIISGGQTGADRAALDVAVELGFDYGGAIPKGRKAEDGSLDLKYNKMTELKSSSYKIRTAKNVTDADTTLIFTMGKPTGGTALTIELVKRHKKPFVVLDLKERASDEGIHTIREWLYKTKPNTLNVAGPRESKNPGIYEKVSNLLREVFKRSN